MTELNEEIMRKFKFMGDPEEWALKFERGKIYDGNERAYKNIKGTIQEAALVSPENWQEVFEEVEQPKPLHKDTDLGYFAGLVMQGLIAHAPNGHLSNFKAGCPLAIQWATELIKQLDEQANKPK